MDSRSLITRELTEASTVLQRFLNDPAALAKVEQAAQTIAHAFASGNKLITCGNGGSHCDAMHMAEELTGRYRENRKALPALCISDPSHLTCVGNDYGFEFVFSRFVEAHGKPGDVLVAISTSGKSPNILRAAETARQQGVQVIALTGNEGGPLAPLADIEIRVPHHGFADRIQEVHIKIIHILILLIEQQVAR
ncbi:MAG: D-sedoheptulose 7-phosphate isomerase [Bacteroidota bacterium]